MLENSSEVDFDLAPGDRGDHLDPEPDWLDVATADLASDLTPRRRSSFLLRMTLAILLATAAVTLFPDGRPDGREVASGVQLRAVRPLPSSVTPSTTTTFVVPTRAPFLVDYVAINAVAAEALAAQREAEPRWIEPELEPEVDWIDAGNGVVVPDLLLRIRFCESTNDYLAAHRVSTASGAYQFLDGSWDWYGHAASYGVVEARLATPAQQDEAAVTTILRVGARPWAESRSCWDDPKIDPRYATARPAAPATTTTTGTDPNGESTTTVPDTSEATSTSGPDSTVPTTIPPGPDDSPSTSETAPSTSV